MEITLPHRERTSDISEVKFCIAKQASEGLKIHFGVQKYISKA